MSENRGRGQPKFEPTQDQRSQVKLMKALGIPEDRICKTITNPRTRKPVAPMTLARAFAALSSNESVDTRCRAVRGPTAQATSAQFTDLALGSCARESHRNRPRP